MECSTRLTKLVIGDETGKFGAFSFGYVAVAATAYGVGIIVRYSLCSSLGLKRKKPLVSRCRASSLRRMASSWDVSGYLTYGPGRRCSGSSSRWGLEFLPERVGLGESDGVEGGMFGAHLVVALGTVLEVVSVAAIAHELFPACGHFGRGADEVVFGPEVVDVVSGIDFLNIVQELFERFSIAVFIEQ